MRRINFFINLFKYNFNIFKKIFLNENREIIKIFEDPLIKYKIINNKLLEISKSEILKFDKLKLKNYLKLKYIENNNLNYVNKDEKIKIKTFSFINLSKNFLKYNILFYENRFIPIF